MKNKYNIVMIFVMMMAVLVVAVPMDFETAAVGRIQGDSLADLENALEISSVNIRGADYYTNQGIPPFEIGYGINEAGLTANVIGDVYERKYTNLLNYGMITNVSEDKMLIVQAEGSTQNNTLKTKGVFDIKPIAVSQTGLGEKVTKSLVIADVDYASTYLPTMSKEESFSTQLAGKGPLIGTNGNANPLFVKSLVCSLALENYEYENSPNDYYAFDSLGDRFRNAKNNLREFGASGTSTITADYQLYGTPYTKITGDQMSSQELEKLCGGFAKYNTYPFANQSIGIQSEGDEIYTKSILLDFSEFKIVEENGYEIIDINGALQKISAGSKILPYAITELEFPEGTIIRDIRVEQKTDPYTINAQIPAWNGEEFVDRTCDDSTTNPIEFSQMYTEDKLIIVTRIEPAEEIDCTQGQYKVYRNVEITAEYTPYSPILIKRIESQDEYFPKELADINAVIENITPNEVTGTIRISDGQNIVSEEEITINGSSEKKIPLVLLIGKEEGYYDYEIDFLEENEIKTRSSFKVKADILNVELEFKGSKVYYDDFENKPLDEKWISYAAYGGTDWSPTATVTQTNGNLNIVANSGMYGRSYDNPNNRTSYANTKLIPLEGQIAFDPNLGGSVNAYQEVGFDYGDYSAKRNAWFDTTYSQARILQTMPENAVRFSFGGIEGISGANHPITYMFPSGVIYSEVDLRYVSWGILPPNISKSDPAVESDWINANKYCQQHYSKSCDEMWGYFIYVNGEKLDSIYKIEDWARNFNGVTISAPRPFDFSFDVSASEFKEGYNKIEVRFDRMDQSSAISSFDVYIEPKECFMSGLSPHVMPQCKMQNKRFSMNDLPITITIHENSFFEQKIYGVINDLTNLGGKITLEKENNETIKWTNYNGTTQLMNVSGWDTNNLGLEFQANSVSTYIYNTAIVKTTGDITAYLIDSENHTTGNSRTAVIEKKEITSESGENSLYTTSINFIIENISRTFENSSRGKAEVLAKFQNKSNETIETNSKYILVDENQSVIADGIFNKNITPGYSEQFIKANTSLDPTKNYSLLMESSYENKSKISSVSFEGNSAPIINSQSYIYANAYDVVKLNYFVTDLDKDELTLNIESPFDLNSEWQTNESDIGIHEIIITASDGIETTTKTIIAEIGPPIIECSYDYDCGNTITVKERVCEDHVLFAEETKPICEQAGTYYSKCSSVQENRTYGSCDFKEEFSSGEEQKLIKFEEAGEQTLHLEVPRKAILQNAVLKINGAQRNTICFDAAQNYDTINSTTIKHSFANGTNFIGLPFGGEILVSSQEATSNPMENFPRINATASSQGVLSSISVVVAGNELGPAGSFIELVAPCAGGRGETWTPNIKSAVDRNIKWIHTGFYHPTSKTELGAYCTWEGGSIRFQTASIPTTYTKAYGYWSGIGDPGSPAHRVYVIQFQTGKELFLGNLNKNVKTVTFNASEDLFGQNIDYFVSPDGINWKPIAKGETIEFSFDEIGDNFNWKAVLNTTHLGMTPRLYSTNLCVDTVGQPEQPAIKIGSKEVWNFSQTNGFSQEIDITEALQEYLATLPASDENVLIPISFSAETSGIIEIEHIGYGIDVHENNAPVISNIEDQYALTGEEFALQIEAIDFEGNEITFSDDSEMFDINSTSGLIRFIPQKAEEGRHNITITASDGLLQSETQFFLNIEYYNHQPTLSLDYNNTFNEGETVKINTNAEDVDGDSIEYSINSPEFYHLENAFYWNTTYSDAGEYIFTITASDGNLSVSQDANITVLNTNRPPYIESFTPDVNELIMYAGDTNLFSVSASDPDNDALEIKWYFNSVLKGEGESYTHIADAGEGSGTLKAEVSDSENSVFNEWFVSVMSFPVLCWENTDCDDSNPHTADICENPETHQAYCNYQSIDCLSDNECDDGNEQTIDYCESPGTIFAECTHIYKIECSQDLDCDDSDEYTQDNCVNAGTPDSYCENISLRPKKPDWMRTDMTSNGNTPFVWAGFGYKTGTANFRVYKKIGDGDWFIEYTTSMPTVGVSMSDYDANIIGETYHYYATAIVNGIESEPTDVNSFTLYYPPCSDTDANDEYRLGLNYYTKGSHLGKEDYCVNDTKLHEYYCSTNNQTFNREYTCEHGCENGACKIPEEMWLELTPIQCGGNPWEQWNSETLYKTETERIKAWLSEVYKIKVYEVIKKDFYEIVCLACSCPRGDKIYVRTASENLLALQKLGFKTTLDNPSKTECNIDKDCVMQTTSCYNCSCPIAINKAYYEPLACEKPTYMCNLYCAPTEPKCVNNQCQAIGEIYEGEIPL